MLLIYLPCEFIKSDYNDFVKIIKASTQQSVAVIRVSEGVQAFEKRKKIVGWKK